MPVTVTPTPRETWTDERRDDLNRKIDDGFREVREEMRLLRGEMNARIDASDARFDAMQRTILQIGAGLFGTMLVGFFGVIATLLATQT